MTITEARITRGNGYGQYIVSGIVNGESIKVRTTNSEAFDWFNDDSNLEKHEEAIEYVQSVLENRYELLNN